MTRDGDYHRGGNRALGLRVLAIEAVVHRATVEGAEANRERLVDSSETETGGTASVVAIHMGASAKSLARHRYTFYKERGYPLKTHNLGQHG